MIDKTNYFITLEGTEGAGKSTALHYLSDYLAQKKKAHIATREPGGTRIAEAIRAILLAKESDADDEHILPETELLLMFAGRVQHIHNVIKPALQAGKTVLCDRFTDASFAYQGAGRGIDSHKIAFLEEWLQAGLQPDITFLLDVPVSIGMSRIQSRGLKDRFEQSGLAFFERLRQGYLERARTHPERCIIIDASRSQAEVQQQLHAYLQDKL